MVAGLGVLGVVVACLLVLRKRNEAKVSGVFKIVLLLVTLVFGCLFFSPIVYATDYGNPLTTTNIGLFAYYNETSDWTLADTVSAWQNYTDNGNYYDGYVRVWQDVTETTFVGDDVYVDVYVRVRADGWILAWLNQSGVHERGDVVFWGHERQGTGNPPANSTVLSRAMYRVYNAAGESWDGYDAINYYDYEYTTATRLVIFGESSPTVEFYCTMPSGVTVVADYASASTWCGSGDYGYFKVNGVTKWSVEAGYDQGWETMDIDVSATETKHSFTITTNYDNYHDFAVILWLS